MHGAVHDWVVLQTIQNGQELPSAEEMHGGPIKNYVDYPFKPIEAQPIFSKILEIGSLDMCGSLKTYNYIDRGPAWLSQISSTMDYTGIDLMDGRGVDIVMDAHDLKFEDETFDLVMCSNMLEHDSNPEKTLSEAYRVLQKGGTFLLTTVNENWEEHPQMNGGSDTYLKITKNDLEKWLLKAGFKKRTDDYKEVLEWHDNLFFKGVK